MSLLQEIQAYYERDATPPEGNEFEPEAEQISYEIVDTARWANIVDIIYKRGNELVCVRDHEPSTEMQDWGDYGEPEIYSVIEYTKTVKAYKRTD